MNGPKPYPFADPSQVLLGLAIVLIFFLAALFNWGNRWKSTSGRRLFLLACVFGVVSGSKLLLEALLRPSSRPLLFVLWVVGSLSLVLAIGLVVAAFFVRDHST